MYIPVKYSDWLIEAFQDYQGAFYYSSHEEMPNSRIKAYGKQSSAQRSWNVFPKMRVLIH